MKKKTFSFVMLSILLAQNFGFAANAYAVTTTEAQTETTDTAKKEAELSNSTPSLPLATTNTSEMNQPTATTESQTTEASTTASSDAATPSEQQTTEDKDTSLNEKALPDVQAPITDELLDSMSLAPIGGTEYSQTEVHRELNTTPVTATFQFAVGNTGYAPGSVYTVQLPEHLGYSTVSGEVTGIGATWAVDAATKTLSITFNQRVSDTSFKVELKSYLTTEAEPLVKIETPGKNKKTYSFDLYEQVEPIQYNERTRTTGLDGSVIKFTTPITNEIQIPIGFNYVPDSLPKDKSIPVDTIPITMSAEGLTPVDTTVTTNSKRGSERTLQSSKNQFLVNARNDSFDSLSVRTKIPAGADVLFDIYDVSNDQVDSIYPQYWDRGYYFDKPMSPDSPGYPTITFDENTNSYTFDFGKTNKRYIIEYKNANGWIDVPTLYITGTAKEPQSNNNEGSASVSVQNEALDILSATQAANPTLKNVTKTTVTTKNIDNKTHRVKNPTIELTPKGTTNAQIDLNSITVKGVPEDAYSLEKTTNGAKIIFKDYTLTENITIEYNTVSANAGQIYTETTIDSETLNQMSASKKKVTTAPITLKFSEGDAEGIVYLATATFYTHNVEDENQAIAKVSFELIDNVTHTATEFTTDEKGQYSFDAIMTGDYTLRVTNVPQEYSVDEEYLTGKAIKLVKGDNQLKIPLTKTIDHSRLQVKDTTIYVGDSWKPEENFVSATDKTGQDVPFEKITVSGQVDTSKAGVYPIVYSYEGKEETANVTVKADQSKLEVKDTTIYVGDKWKPEDNFVSATDKTGQDVPFEKIDVQGTVNVDKIGDYEIVYKNGTKEAKAIVHVRDDSRLQVKDTTIYVGDSWKPEENFVSATDKTDQDVPFEKITVSGQVDTSKAGVYPIVYSYEGKEETAHVTVKPDQSKLEVKDTTIYVGDKWKPEDNFVSATDRDGHAISFDKVQVKGEVDTKKTGEYQISYTTEPVNETKPAVQSRLFSMFSNETPRQLTTVATVHVIDRNPTPLPDKNENNQTSSSTNQTTIKRSQYVTHIVKPDKQGRYPKTGEQTNGLYRVLGLVVLLIVIISGIVIKKKRK